MIQKRRNSNSHLSGSDRINSVKLISVGVSHEERSLILDMQYGKLRDQFTAEIKVKYFNSLPDI